MTSSLPDPALMASSGTGDHRNRPFRDPLSHEEGAKAPRIMPRVDANAKAVPPPPWFTFMAAVVPALPCMLFIPARIFVVWHPLWVLAFYFLPRPVPQLSPMLVLCFVVTFRALLHEGWVGWYSLAILTALVGFLMNLAHSAFWDTLEPFLVGTPGFGAGKRVPSKLPRAVEEEPVHRVTAASSVRMGDPVRAAAASAFTQRELDALAAQGIKPWDPEARAALEALGW